MADTKRKEIRIPVTTLLTVDENKAAVYVVKKDRVFKRDILIGNEEKDLVEVFEGLLSDEMLVDAPPINLLEGMTVTY